MPFTESQFKQLALWPKVTSMLSLFGSLAICHSVLRNRKKRCRVLFRLLAAMSISDIITSLFKFLSTWPIPRGARFVYDPKGTQATCSAQGFFMQFAVATPLYNMFLSLYYLLSIRYRWRESDLKKLEWVAHLISIGFAVVTSFVLLILKQYNSSLLWCGIASKPINCKGSYRNNGINDCERGNNAWIFRFAFYYVPIWVALIGATFAMFMTHQGVNMREKASLKWATTLVDGNRRTLTRNIRRLRHSQSVKAQAIWYLMAFFISFLPGSLAQWFRASNGKLFYGGFLFVAIVSPMQGFFNYLVYIRPKFSSVRRKHPDWSLFKIVRQVISTDHAFNVSQTDLGKEARRVP